MLAMAKVDSIRKAYFEEGRSVSEISRLLKADRKTVRKYIDKEDFNITPVPVKTRNSAAKLEPFKAVIDEWLEGDKSFKKKQRHTAKRVYDRLLAEEPDFSSSYRSVAEYVREKKACL